MESTPSERRSETDAEPGRFRRLIEAAPVAIGVSAGERVVYGNPAFRRLFGLADGVAIESLQVPDLIAPSARPEMARRSARPAWRSRTATRPSAGAWTAASSSATSRSPTYPSARSRRRWSSSRTSRPAAAPSASCGP
ncbi:PAS domain-containing protein [Ideonella sp. 4Y16]|uniref:PAS domain-containing protein n=1 Tax=Ideonella alba TaxID=2824118 RepID=A0A941BFW6_9BURK|nr:PAS domain-containing protein [Ideonella alba]MBQ0943777.1 PAS domain-containing protein [Ideonella alba]